MLTLRLRGLAAHLIREGFGMFNVAVTANLTRGEIRATVGTLWKEKYNTKKHFEKQRLI